MATYIDYRQNCYNDSDWWMGRTGVVERNL